jgi:hypothetical protein
MDILVSLAVVIVIAAVLYWIITLLPFPFTQLRQIALIILALVTLFWILRVVGFIGGVGWRMHFCGR